MSNYGIIIQETTSGLNTQYQSSTIDVNADTVKNTILDERILATQLANQSKFYSVEVNNKYKVYTYANPNVTDEFGRSGYYAIKIYLDNKFVQLTNLISIFNKIEERYLSYKAQNNLSSQNYDDILALLDGKEKPAFLTVKEPKTFVHYFTPGLEDDLVKALNQDSVYTIEKLYAFDQSKAMGETQIAQFGLKPFSSYQIKKATFVNEYSILQSIAVNGQAIDLNGVNRKDFKLVYPQSLDGQVAYNTTLRKNLKVQEFNSLEKPAPPPPPPYSGNGGHRRGKKEKNHLAPIALGVLGIALLGGLGYFVYNYFNPTPEPIINRGPIITKNDSINNDTINLVNEKLTIDIVKYEENKFLKFEGDSIEVKNNYYQIKSTQLSQLQDFYFKNKNAESFEYYPSFEDLKANQNKKTIKNDLAKFLNDNALSDNYWEQIVDAAKLKELDLPRLVIKEETKVEKFNLGDNSKEIGKPEFKTNVDDKKLVNPEIKPNNKEIPKKTEPNQKNESNKASKKLENLEVEL